MTTMTAALVLVPRREIARHSGASWLEFIAAAAHRRKWEAFVRPLLEAQSETEALVALRVSRLKYVAGQVTTVALTLALKPWEKLTPALTQEFYEEIQDRLRSSNFDEETSQSVDYVAYSMCRIALTSKNFQSLVTRPKPRASRGFGNLASAVSQLAAFDLLVSAAIMGTFQPESIRNPAVFSWLMKLATKACDAYLAVLAEYGFLGT
jgi:hypothetical protein